MEKEELVKKVKELNFPIGEYVIFGSAIMCMVGIRKCHDIDIVVSEKIWNECLKSDKWKLGKALSGSDKLTLQNIELFKNWNPGEWDVTELINTSEIIDEIPFVNRNHLIRWKKLMNREKDRADIELIKNHFNK